MTMKKIIAGAATACLITVSALSFANQNTSSDVPVINQTTAVLNPFSPKTYDNFVNPGTHKAYMNAMTDPKQWTQFMQPQMYMQMANPQLWAEWMNPASYAAMMNPNTYMHWMQPNIWFEEMNAFNVNAMMDPNSYMGFMNPATYMSWADPNSYTAVLGDTATAVPGANFFDINTWTNMFLPTPPQANEGANQG